MSRIIELRTENTKNIKAVEIRPGDGPVVLTGKNGAGKSAVLESIEIALTGKKLEKPIRNGETRAEINIDLGDYKIKKVLTPNGSRLIVVGKDGAAYPSPQALLDKMYNYTSFDPLAFAGLGKTKAGEREQREILAKLVGIDFAGLDAKRQELYDERTVRFRQIKGMDPSKYSADPTKPLAIDALIGDMEVPAKDTPRIELSMAESLAKISEMEKTRKLYDDECLKISETHKTEISNKVAVEEALSRQIFTDETNAKSTDLEIQRIRKELQKKIDELNALNERLEINRKQLEKSRVARIEDPIYPKEPISLEEIAVAKESLKEVEEKNKSIRAAIAYDKRVEQLQGAKDEIDSLTRQMEKIDREKKEAVASAKFPIEGLAIDDLRVTYQGKPLTQLSTGEQIRVSAAVAMALNPNLRVILVREGSLLDEEALAELVALAKERDYQLWIERVSSDKSVGVYIEDGAVAEEPAASK